MKLPVYMDYQATTPLDPRVFQKMEPYFTGDFGNAASKGHRYGWKAEAAVEIAREQLAASLGGIAEHYLFTSGATESNNLALLGLMRGLRDQGDHVITVQTEHLSVLDSCRQLEKEGFRVTFLGVNSQGEIDLAELQAAMTEQTVLVSVMAANNEIGTLAPLAKIGAIVRRQGILFHTDAAQAAGKVPIDVEAAQIDLLSLTAHKIYGPKGIGALYLGPRVPKRKIVPLVFGGGHEIGLRSGTLNVPGVVGLAAALSLAVAEMDCETTKMLQFRDRILVELVQGTAGVSLNGSLQNRLAQNLNLCLADVPSDRLLMEVKSELALATGSACSSNKKQTSHVLKALGLSEAASRSSIRISMGRFTDLAEVEHLIAILGAQIEQIRSE